jgi:hypothetical protein
MNEQYRHTTSSNDDIDLLLLIERLILFFRRYSIVFIICVILGLASGFFMYRYLPTIYQSRMVVHSFLLTNQEQIKIIDNWNDLLAKDEYDELVATLHCPKDILPRVKKITAEEIQKVFSTTNPNGFTIEVNITDNAILDDLQNGLVYGLENTEYVKERLAARRASLGQLIDKTSTEIVRLDSTKKAIENIIEGKGKSSSSVIIEGATINRQLIDMNEKLLGYKDELKFTSSVQVYQGFSKFSRPIGPHLLPWLFIGIIVFVPLGFLFAFASSIEKRIKGRRDTSMQLHTVKSNS